VIRVAPQKIEHASEDLKISQDLKVIAKSSSHLKSAVNLREKLPAEFD